MADDQKKEESNFNLNDVLAKVRARNEGREVIPGGLGAYYDENAPKISPMAAEYFAAKRHKAGKKEPEKNGGKKKPPKKAT